MKSRLNPRLVPLTSLAAFLLVSAVLGAQTSTQSRTSPQAIVVSGSTRYGPGPRAVTGAPYSAQEISETVQTLVDGNRITRKMTAKVYRESEGRTRREMFLPSGYISATPPDSPSLVSIFDPVAEVSYDLDLRDHTARRHPLAPRFLPKPANQGNPAPSRPQITSKSEDLGTQEIEGLEAHGTRITTTFPAGLVGNEKPIETVSEQWYSTELQIPVLIKQSDPRMGETVTRLANISRDEPAHSLFEVPPDFDVIDPLVVSGTSPAVK